MSFRARPGSVADAQAIASIYNEGIADRIGTFETEPRTAEQIAAWFEGHHPIVVVEEGKEVVAFAATSAYRGRPCYTGVAEFSVYVTRGRRSSGAGHVAMEALLEAATAAGFWKLLSRIFPENKASRALMAKVGFREVGIYARHAKLEGVWRDCVIVERLLGEAALQMRRGIVVSTLGITQTLARGSTYCLTAIFANPISEALQLPHAWFFGTFSAALLLSGLLGPLAGPHDRPAWWARCPQRPTSSSRPGSSPRPSQTALASSFSPGR